MIVLTDEQQKDVEENMNLVYYLVNRINIESFLYDDVVSEGFIGLCKGVATFDKEKGIKFATYVSKCIMNEIYMFFRKNNKHALVMQLEASLLNVDDEDDESDVNKISSRLVSEENFVEDIVNNEEFEARINLIINYLPTAEKILMLLFLSGVIQTKIAEVLNWSQSYVSRLEKAIQPKLMWAEKYNAKYRKVYDFKMKNNEYVLTFSSKKVKDFPKILSVLIEKLAVSESKLTDFRLICDKERIVILLPKEEKAFAFIAQIVKETDCFVLDYKQKESEILETDSKEVISPKYSSESFLMDTLTKESEESVSQDISSAQFEVPDEYEDNSDEKEIASNTVLNTNNSNKKQVKTRAPRNPVYGVVIDWINSKEEISFSEIAKKFPNENRSTINNILIKAKKNGNIVSIGKGKYKVIK